MSLKSVVRHGSSAIAGFSAVSLGALAFIGILLFSASLPEAVATFLLASLIEGEIYKQIIQAAMEYLFIKGPINALYQHIAERELTESSKRYRRFVLQGNMDAVHAMEMNFLLIILNPANNDSTNILQLRNKILSEVRRKKILLYSSAIIAIAAAVSSGFATLSAAFTGMTTLGVAVTTAFWGAIGIASISAVGYAFIMYKCLADMIQNDTLQNGIKKAYQYFSYRSQESTLHYLVRCIPAIVVVTLVVALAAFATVATAGTWWIATKRGALLIGVVDKIASIGRSISVICMSIPSFFFNAINALVSTNNIVNSQSQTIKDNFYRHFILPLEGKNLLQWANPFYWLVKSSQCLIHVGIFIGHSVSVGLTSDGLPGVSPKISTASGTLIEFLTDWHFLFEFGSDVSHDHHHEDCGKQHHGHHHSNLPSVFAKIILLPVTALAKIWDWVFTTPGQQETPEIHQEDHSYCHHNHVSENGVNDTSFIFSSLKLQQDESPQEDDLPELVPIDADLQGNDWSPRHFPAAHLIHQPAPMGSAENIASVSQSGIHSI